MALLLKHQSIAEFTARFRNAYLESEGERTIALAKAAIRLIASNDITDAQLRSQFGLSTAQYNSLKAEWTNLINSANAIKDARGR